MTLTLKPNAADTFNKDAPWMGRFPLVRTEPDSYLREIKNAPLHLSPSVLSSSAAQTNGLYFLDYAPSNMPALPSSWWDRAVQGFERNVLGAYRGPLPVVVGGHLDDGQASTFWRDEFWESSNIRFGLGTSVRAANLIRWRLAKRWLDQLPEGRSSAMISGLPIWIFALEIADCLLGNFPKNWHDLSVTNSATSSDGTWTGTSEDAPIDRPIEMGSRWTVDEYDLVDLADEVGLPQFRLLAGRLGSRGFIDGMSGGERSVAREVGHVGVSIPESYGLSVKDLTKANRRIIERGGVRLVERRVSSAVAA